MQDFRPTRELFGERYSFVQNRMKKVKIMIALITVMAMIMCFLMCFTAAYRVDKMNVSSSAHYSTDEILEAAGLSEKSDMITFNAEKAEAAIQAACPYLKNVTVECDYPNTVNIEVSDETNLFYTKSGSQYVVLADDLRVIEVVDDSTELAAKGYMQITVPDSKTAVVGEKLSATDGRDMTYAVTFISSVLDSEFGSEITSVDVAEKFNLSVTCGAHVLYFGSSSNMETKLMVAYNMIDEGVFSRYASALCNISDPTGATVRENTSFTVDTDDTIVTSQDTSSTASSNGAVG